MQKQKFVAAQNTPTSSHDIAIVGVNSIFPGSEDPASFWRNILEGTDLLTDIPATHFLMEDYYSATPTKELKTWARKGGFLSETDFDPLEFGIPPAILPTTDVVQLLALKVAKGLLESVQSVATGKVDKKEVGVILGIASATSLVGEMFSKSQKPVWLRALNEAGLPADYVQTIADAIDHSYTEWTENTFPGMLGNVVAGRIANRLDLGGTNCVIDAACASSLAAVSAAIQELQLGYADMMIAGGADALNNILMYMCFTKTPAMSMSNDCRPFSNDADGTMMCEGVGMVALRRLADAERDGDRILAVIRGVGSSSDGRSKSVYAPVAEGQALAIKRAYARAGFTAQEVELVEAHGTATKAGDAAEFEGLKLAFGGSETAAKQTCALGSIKSQLGHAKAAAGSASLLKIALALQQKVLPPTIKVTKPNPKLDIENSPFYLNTKKRPWIHSPTSTRKAAVSSFGFGGSNFHIALQEYSGANVQRVHYSPVDLFLFGAASTAELSVAINQLAAAVTDRNFVALAKKSQTTFATNSFCRLAVTAASSAQLQQVLKNVLQKLAENKGENKGNERRFSLGNDVHFASGECVGKVAFVFPGQGSQYVGMAGDVLCEFDTARKLWDDLCDVDLGGPSAQRNLKLQDLVYPIPVFESVQEMAQNTALAQTEWAQPSIAAASASYSNVLQLCGVQADMVAGHSLGELSALCMGGVIDSQQTLVEIARQRGLFMAEAARDIGTQGAMTAVFSGCTVISALLSEHKSSVLLVNDNAPNQVVIAGEKTAVEAFEAVLEQNAVRFQRLNVSTAFHTSFVAAASKNLAQALDYIPFNAPRIPVYSNTTARPYAADPQHCKDVLAEQLALPVRFKEMVEQMYVDGARIFIEVGPSAVLTRLVADCLADKPILVIALDKKNANGLTSLWNALGQIAVTGVAIDFAPLWKNIDLFRAAHAYAPSSATVKLTGSNYKKPYPLPHGEKLVKTPLASLVPKMPATAATSIPANILNVETSIPMNTPYAPTDPRPLAAQATPAVHTVAAHQGPSNEWLHTFKHMHENIVKTQAHYMQVMSETHLAFLAASELKLDQLEQAGQLGGVYAPTSAPGYASAPAAPHARVSALATEYSSDPAPAFSQRGEISRLASTSGAATNLAFMPAPIHHIDPTPAPILVIVPDTTVTPAAASSDMKALLLAVVSEKTGYPTEMLDLSMNLEADLGIDSIKRVEILSQLQSSIPALNGIDATKLATLATLNEILEFSSAFAGSLTAATTHKVNTAPNNPSTQHQSTHQSNHQTPSAALDVKNILLGVVAEKTGYPMEMLDLSMNLEADLGIDSIKRVEILSDLQTKMPELQGIDTQKLASLSTLKEIMDFSQTYSLASLAPTQAEKKSLNFHQFNAIHKYDVQTTAVARKGLCDANLFSTDSVVVVPDNRGVAPRLVDQLNAAGIHAVLAVLDDEGILASASKVISLLGINHYAEPSAEQYVLENAAQFSVAAALGKTLHNAAGVFIAVQDTGGSFALNSAAGDRLWRAGAAALVKTANKEWPDVYAKAIDVDCSTGRAADIADLLFQEIVCGGPEQEVSYNAERVRCVVDMALSDFSNQDEDGHAVAITPQDVLLVSGGARGVTAACIIEYSKHFPAKIAIFGRSQLQDEPGYLAGASTDAQIKAAVLAHNNKNAVKLTPKGLAQITASVVANREVKATLQAIQKNGVQVHYWAVDITDSEQVQRAVSEVRAQLGAISMLVHGAGVLADKLIHEKSREQFALVFDTKVVGLKNLLAALTQDPLHHICCFSSIAARMGNRGQCDYAMANEILNKACLEEKYQRGDRCHVKSINWGPWDGGMVRPELKAHFESQGIHLIPMEEGARAFVHEMQAHLPGVVEVVIGGAMGGAFGVSAQGESRKQFRLTIDTDTNPLIAHHKIKNTPVVPMVMVHDWFAAIAKALSPTLHITFKNLQVVSGMSLTDYATGSDIGLIEVIKTAHNAYEFTLRGLHRPDKLLYKATCLLSDTLLDGEVGAEFNLTQSVAWNLDVAQVYEQSLFHDVDLQVIAAGQQMASDGCDAVLQTALTADDARLAVLDGGLQLALLHKQHLSNTLSLPTGFGALQIVKNADWNQQISCKLIVVEQQPLFTKNKIAWLDSDNRLLARMDDLTMFSVTSDSLR